MFDYISFQRSVAITPNHQHNIFCGFNSTNIKLNNSYSNFIFYTF
ncbi:hypothetical protein KsCSTR_08440 [Candidatus Kuenenia stuttgartiensis]|uniref:Uncharacterized protein n=1 Tax=Kuenenia stuttgartiensis TaxID=174633 RepID=Q1PZ88_KUEST|nr:hypothetical protein KsCSTR_08440 [Candidatus Kuenenia stuttgartiensis]CAJ72400.1 unknown protein [Candidatus Kuenenia stuttgartiensis]